MDRHARETLAWLVQAGSSRLQSTLARRHGGPMATIGGRSVITVKGAPAPVGTVVADVSRPGVTGHAFQELGARAEPVVMESVIDCTDNAALKAEILEYVALQGTLVTVVDDLGNTWTNVMVLRVRTGQGKYVASAVGGVNGGNYLLRATWEMIFTELVA
jgi:hypothetical protein